MAKRELPEAGFYGNLGRNTVIGPGLANFDFSVVKNIPFRETKSVQFRAEAFNLFNHALISVGIVPNSYRNPKFNVSRGMIR